MKIGSFDVIGSIAILPFHSSNAKQQAKTLLAEHKNIKSVFLKTGKIKGRLRKLKLKFIAGINSLETIYKENNCLMKLNVQDCYFSQRLSNDRLEIANKVKKNEKVLVMFAGVAPYSVVIAKHSKAKEVYSVELNTKATKYALENARLNKLSNVIVIQGDVKKVIPKLKKNRIMFDRIVMARPQLKDTFLKEALMIAKKACIIHFYDFLQENEIPHEAIRKIQDECKKTKRRLKILSWKKAGDIAPYRYRIRVDFSVY